MKAVSPAVPVPFNPTASAPLTPFSDSSPTRTGALREARRAGPAAAARLDNFHVMDATGARRSLGEYAGRALLIVNTASNCRFTPQYAGLQGLQERFWNKGFTVLAFPCNQFGQQEPGTDEEIAEFCDHNYKITFPIFARVDVRGSGATPLFHWLSQSKPGMLGTASIKWNFTKFLVGRDGNVRARYSPMTSPADIAQDIARAL